MNRPSMTHIIATVINDVNYDQRMQRICTSLAEAGYQVTLVGRKRYFSEPLKERPYRQKRFTCWWNTGKLFYIEYNLRLFFYLLTHRFDIVCSVDMDTLLPGYLSALIKRKTCVYDAHEYFSEVPELTHRPFTRKCWQWLENRLIHRVKFKYTVNQSLAELMGKEFNTDFEVIRNVPMLTEEEVSDKEAIPDEPYLFYQGVLNVGRYLPQLVEAISSLDMPLYLAGKGDIAEALKRQVRQAGLEEQVHFLGFVPPKQLKPWMEGATLGINLIEDRGRSYYYSLANKFFDYIHAGLPQITMNFPEYRHINDQYEVALLIDEAQPETLRNAIRKLRADRAYYEQLQNNCLEACQRYNWQRESEKLLELYNQIPS
jgi:glycosyltransferase involved in cell wall biosynthesis